MITFQHLGRLGRFGNQLFQIAGTIGIARKHGYDVGFPRWMNYDHAERFGSTEDCELGKYFVNPLPIWPGEPKPQFDIPWGYHSPHIPDNISLYGHLQSEKYFKHCIDEVRHYFTMKLMVPVGNFLAIHLRRGDYDDQYHPRLNFNYYLHALAFIPEPDGICIFSDDPNEADVLANLIRSKTKVDVTVFRKTTYMEDFAIMKNCSYFITANSTFSLMAAILSTAPNKKIVCPANWFGPAWGSECKEMAKDIYPENAIVI